ncbi:FK506-binding protein 15 [Trichonephila clavata]|uniref:peptidylprolyl isomerase n=1 Tax=Trichonephila clavata TaxID=2740835 RepID=A0A8X6M2L7_TRICU|nr:FK506-binding protein 15 [Trichonephila clavata]
MDDDEGDFSLNPTARSRLSSLFQTENVSGDVNQALTFTAPKQPRKNESTQSSAGTFKLLHASVVHAYKLKDGNYANQGKLGCAILGLHENASYKFLLYKGKQIQVTASNIVPSFKFHIQPNNYVNFFDEKNENWSINFDSETQLTEFAKQVALAKANSEGKNSSSLIVQDLVLGDGPSVDTGDSAEIRYTSWSLSNHVFGQVLDSNMKSESAFRLRLGKSKINKGLSDGLIGAQKGSRRLLIIPPNLIGEGTSPSVPPNTTVIFEILVIKVKISRESSHSPSPIKVPDNTAEKKPEVMPRPSISHEDNIRSRGASISEQLSQSPKKDKAQLISRMAKMGTATLPFQGPVVAHVSSESENEEEIPSESPQVQSSSSRTASPKHFTKPSSRKDSGASLVGQTVPMQTVQPQFIQENMPIQSPQLSSQMSVNAAASLPTQQPYLTPSSTISYPAYQPQFQAPFPIHSMPGMMPTSMADTHLPMLITETRNQNTEVRLSLSKITDKVDTVLQKVDDLRLQQGRTPSLSPAPFMDSSILVQNIERIVQENKQLKEEIETKNSKIQSLNEKICDLFQRNQRFFEESNNMLEQRSDSIQAVSTQSQTKILSLENEKAKLSSDLMDATSRLNLLETELNKFRSHENELKQKLLDYEKEAEMRLSDSNSQNESLLNSLKQQVKNAEEENILLTEKLNNLETQYNQLLESKAVLDKLVKENESKIEEIKSKTEKEVKEMYDKEIKYYQEKCNEVAAATSEKSDTLDSYNIEIETLKREKEQTVREREDLFAKNQELQKKLKASETSQEMHEKKLLELQKELENALSWKRKYEVFYEKTKAMKEKYENQIVELISDIKQLRAAGPGQVSSNFSGEIKKVMNALYKILQGKFEADSSYSGTKVLELTLQSIRVLTFQMLEMKSRASSSSSEHDAESVKASSTVATSEKTDVSEVDASEPQTTNLQSKESEESSSSSLPVQENGLDEAHVESEINTAAISETPANDKLIEQHISDVEKPEVKLEANSVPKEIECDQNGLENSGDLKSSDAPLTSEVEESKAPAKNSKEVNANRSSPEIWKPQPPPLFDDDDDDEDDDDWLK